MDIEIRQMTLADVPSVAALAIDSHWTADDYLMLETLIAIEQGCVVGFAAARTLVADTEHEILNIQVDKPRRGQGIGSKLLKTLLGRQRGIWFLEVRESNAVAIGLYKSLGFNNFGRRKAYYQNPDEDAIVMRVCS